MRKVKLYIAMSLDGKVAGPDNDVKWLEELPNPDKLDYGYAEFYESVDITIMGNTTYKMIQGFEGPFPYPNSKNYVATRQGGLKDTPDVTYTNDPIALVTEFKTQEGKDIWLIGGGQLNTLFWNQGLVDELLIFVMPIVLGEGVGLFEGIANREEVTLIDSQTYSSGVVSLIYSIKK